MESRYVYISAQCITNIFGGVSNLHLLCKSLQTKIRMHILLIWVEKWQQKHTTGTVDNKYETMQEYNNFHSYFK